MVTLGSVTYRRVSTVEEALRRALLEEEPARRDLATVELAMRYARAIDKGAGDPMVLAKVGPPLMVALEALHMSPRSRAVKAKGGVEGAAETPAPVNPLDELANARARKGRTADMDPTPP